MNGVDRRVLLSAGAFAASGSVSAAGARAATRSSDDMIDTLRAEGPHIIAGEDPQARIFDGFIGRWDTEFTFIQQDGSRLHATGQFIAGWVLDGHAVQDLWIGVPPGRTERWMGTTLRFFDPERRTWRVTWVSPFEHAVTLLEGRGDAGRIVLVGEAPQGRLRWSFYDIGANDFSWTGELSVDKGVTWRVREQHHMRRTTA